MGMPAISASPTHWRLRTWARGILKEACALLVLRGPAAGDGRRRRTSMVGRALCASPALAGPRTRARTPPDGAQLLLGVDDLAPAPSSRRTATTTTRRRLSRATTRRRRALGRLPAESPSARTPARLGGEGDARARLQAWVRTVRAGELATVTGAWPEIGWSGGERRCAHGGGAASADGIRPLLVAKAHTPAAATRRAGGQHTVAYSAASVGVDKAAASAALAEAHSARAAMADAGGKYVPLLVQHGGRALLVKQLAFRWDDPL